MRPYYKSVRNENKNEKPLKKGPRKGLFSYLDIISNIRSSLQILIVLYFYIKHGINLFNVFIVSPLIILRKRDP